MCPELNKFVTLFSLAFPFIREHKVLLYLVGEIIVFCFPDAKGIHKDLRKLILQE